MLGSVCPGPGPPDGRFVAEDEVGGLVPEDGVEAPDPVPDYADPEDCEPEAEEAPEAPEPEPDDGPGFGGGGGTLEGSCSRYALWIPGEALVPRYVFCQPIYMGCKSREKHTVAELKKLHSLVDGLYSTALQPAKFPQASIHTPKLGLAPLCKTGPSAA